MLLALAAVFVLPFAVGSGLFWSGWRPAALRNHGELVQPPRALPESAAALHGKWLLIEPARDDCGPACQETLHRLRQGFQVGLVQGCCRQAAHSFLAVANILPVAALEADAA